MRKAGYLPNRHLKTWNPCLCHYRSTESRHQKYLQIRMWIEYSFDVPMMFPAQIRQGIERREGARWQQCQIPFDGWLLCCEPLARTVYIESIEGNNSLLELAYLTSGDATGHTAERCNRLIDGLRIVIRRQATIINDTNR